MKSYRLIGPPRKPFILETPVLLTYGIETVILIEIGCFSNRVLHLSLKENEIKLKTNLDIEKKAQLDATIRNRASRRRET